MYSENDIDKAIKDVSTRPVRNRKFGRAIRYKHRNDLFGSKRTTTPPQRFNKENGARVLYLSDNYVSSLSEVQALGVTTTMSTWIIFPVNVELNSVIDLTDPKTQKHLDTTIDELTENFRRYISIKSPTQILGEACNRSNNIDGILFPSAIKSNEWVNLAVFIPNLSKLNSRIFVNEPDGIVDQIPMPFKVC